MGLPYDAWCGVKRGDHLRGGETLKEREECMYAWMCQGWVEAWIQGLPNFRAFRFLDPLSLLVYLIKYSFTFQRRHRALGVSIRYGWTRNFVFQTSFCMYTGCSASQTVLNVDKSGRCKSEKGLLPPDD